ncbi:glycosyltransferase [Falsibacillus pallidus]|uniref:Glycosyltransferase involved in cell wall biosynthesis n=1 Tax=Falsibacillus pallidus TaxID=493781 RepID=A0A370GPV8_9BACI|nr:glycosyltransferase [Falsibacillus pallidus]RDI45717.1 glycosyltransferase involved in cell wall biosynthesis [Falsibacillus pallidus]
MKNILIASFDMEVGGVERSLISMLNNFDYESYQVDLMLYSHTGDFMNLLPLQTNLLPEIKKYKTFRLSIKEMISKGELSIAFVRLIAKYLATLTNATEEGYKQMQYMWKYALPFLPKLEKEYDIAISYLWPHYFVAEKVNAKLKIAWVHTDFSVIDTDEKLDIKMWSKFDYIAAVSSECKKAFLEKYPVLHGKVIVIENITSPDFIRKLADEGIEEFIKNDSRFKVVTVGRLSHAKGIDMAVDALKILKDKDYPIVWYIVGYGGDESKIRELVAVHKLENEFILLGKKINPYPYIKIADLYVQPSRYEGKAVTVGEAQILAKPVMITNYTTASSQLRDGLDGYICKLSAEGIADGIEKLYRDNELKMSLEMNCKSTDFSNTHEINKLYQIM